MLYIVTSGVNLSRVTGTYPGDFPITCSHELMNGIHFLEDVRTSLKSFLGDWLMMYYVLTTLVSGL